MLILTIVLAVFILLDLVAWLYYRQFVVKRRLLVQLLINKIPTTVGEPKPLMIQGMRKTDQPVPSPEFDATVAQLEDLVKSFGYTLDPNIRDLINTFVTLYHTAPADFKKQTTQTFYDFMVANSGLTEDKCYDLAFVFNKTLDDFIYRPDKALLDFAYRFYVYLRKFGYLKIKK